MVKKQKCLSSSIDWNCWLTILTVFAMDYLEVFDGGLGDPAVKVENMRRSFFIPHRCLVVKLDQIVHLSILVPYQQAVTVLPRIDKTEVRKKHQQSVIWLQMIYILTLCSSHNKQTTYHKSSCKQYGYHLMTLCIAAGDSGMKSKYPQFEMPTW